MADEQEQPQKVEKTSKGKFLKIAQYVGAAGSVIGVVAGGIVWMFSTFASASDFKQFRDDYKKDQEQVIQKQETQFNSFIQLQERQFDMYRKEKYEEKLLELRSISNPDQATRAQIQHFEDKLREITRKINH